METGYSDMSCYSSRVRAQVIITDDQRSPQRTSYYIKVHLDFDQGQARN